MGGGGAIMDNVTLGVGAGGECALSSVKCET